jgi:hypothetical protein
MPQRVQTMRGRNKAAAGDQKALGFLLNLANEPQPVESGSSGAGLSAHQNEIIQEFLKRHQRREDDEP